jgi:hypothetical protein
MPTDACLSFYECRNCKALLRRKPGDCCVFCSYGSVKCPPVQDSTAAAVGVVANETVRLAVTMRRRHNRRDRTLAGLAVSRPTALFLFSAAIIAVVVAAPVRAEVYRCTVDGTVTYSDEPCGGARTGKSAQGQATVPLPSPVTTPAGAPANFYGQWTGQAQYQATARSQPIETAHAVVTLTLIVGADGKLTGESTDNGCRALGLASPQTLETLKLDVTLTGCRYAGFNRRYTGTFALPPEKGYATVSLLAYDTRPETPSVVYDITATMRR